MVYFQRLDFEQVLKEVVWRLVTEGRISYRQITDGGIELRVGWPDVDWIEAAGHIITAER